MGASTDHVSATTRLLASDEQGVGLRATWRPRYGFINLSLWRDQRCVETFHLSPAESARLVGFLADSLASGAPDPQRLPLRMVQVPATKPERVGAESRLDTRLTAARRRTASKLEGLAQRLRT
jgi:hypothetical protein